MKTENKRFLGKRRNITVEVNERFIKGNMKFSEKYKRFLEGDHRLFAKDEHFHRKG